MMAKWCVLVPFLLSVSLAEGGKVYSYVNKAGVKVFTNLGASRGGSRVTLDQPRRTGSTTTVRSEPFSELIEQIAQRYSEDEELIRAIISVESAFDPRAVSTKNCKGLMQLHPDTALRYGVEDVFDPAQNIEGGVRYLQDLRDRFDDQLDLVLAAYNAGENAVQRYDGVPPYRETQNYIHKVRARYDPGDRVDSERAKDGGVIYRVVMPDGRILLTNVPSREVEAKQPAGRRGAAVRVNLQNSR